MQWWNIIRISRCWVEDIDRNGLCVVAFRNTPDDYVKCFVRRVCGVGAWVSSLRDAAGAAADDDDVTNRRKWVVGKLQRASVTHTYTPNTTPTPNTNTTAFTWYSFTHSTWVWCFKYGSHHNLLEWANGYSIQINQVLRSAATTTIIMASALLR